MLEISESILRKGYTITITKDREENFQGLYSKNMSNGLNVYTLPQEELIIFTYLPNISELLSEGELLQISMPSLSFETLIGKIKTEGQYCETKYLEVHGTTQSFGYCDCLINLNEQLGVNRYQNASNTPQYKKAYRGENRYE